MDQRSFLVAPKRLCSRGVGYCRVHGFRVESVLMLIMSVTDHSVQRNPTIVQSRRNPFAKDRQVTLPNMLTYFTGILAAK